MLNVIYIDDEQDLCEIFVDLFSSATVKVEAFSDPNLGMAAIKAQSPDLLFLDYRMPGTTGDALALSLDRSIPKFLVSGDLGVATSYPFDGILTKPYPTEEIESIMAQYLSKKKSVA